MSLYFAIEIYENLYEFNFRRIIDEYHTWRARTVQRKTNPGCLDRLTQPQKQESIIPNSKLGSSVCLIIAKTVTNKVNNFRRTFNRVKYLTEYLIVVFVNNRHSCRLIPPLTTFHRVESTHKSSTYLPK